MVNRIVTLESDYEYVAGQLRGNIMNLQASFNQNEWAKEDLMVISKELVNTAKFFAAQQGLSAVSQVQDYSVNGTPVYINRKNRKKTGTLINSIKARPEGNTVVFWNDANLGRGYYAGHIEYGFHDRSGKPVAARPFMRPAFQAVARASRNQLSNTLYNFLQGGLVQNTTAKFAVPRSGSYLKAFYNQPVVGRGAPRSGTKTTSGLLRQGSLGNASKMRASGTIRRDGSTKGFINNKLSGRSSPPRSFVGTKTISRKDSVVQRISNSGSKSSSNTPKQYNNLRAKSKSVRESANVAKSKKPENEHHITVTQRNQRANIFATLRR